MARKSKQEGLLTESNIRSIREMVVNGVSEEKIAETLGISYSTFRRWKSDNEQLQSVLKEGRDISNNLVENALFKRALGYSVEEVTKERDNITGKIITTKIVTKHIQPDTTAQIFWLKNHMPDKYVDKQVQDINFDNVEQIAISFKELVNK